MNLSSDTFAALALLMFLTGVGIPIMAAFNGGLVHNPPRKTH